MEVFEFNNIILYKDQYVWGDGTHPSTIGCTELLKKLDLKNKKVLDIGTGTGVQAIMAKKLGAGEVLAVDINPGAIGLGEYNAKVNNVNIDFKLILEDEKINYKADVVIANLPPHILIKYLYNIHDYMNPGCKVIVSMPDEFNMRVELNNSKSGLKIVDKYIDNIYCVFLLEEE